MLQSQHKSRKLLMKRLGAMFSVVDHVVQRTARKKELYPGGLAKNRLPKLIWFDLTFP